MLTLPEFTGPSSQHSMGRITPDESIVLISRLQLPHRHVPAFLVASLRLAKEFRRTPGALSLRLGFMASNATFFVWSSFDSHAHMRDYVASTLHRKVMTSFHPRMSQANFVTFDQTAAREAPASWQDVTRILASTGRTPDEPARHHAADRHS